jgi:hypothetical protein
LDGPTFGQLLQSGIPIGLPPGLVESGEFQVVCTAPKIATLSAEPNILWPPNHKMVHVSLTGATTGGCGAVTCRIASVSSNEPINADGDWVISGNLTLNLRADRLGTGTGRVYSITVQCTDGAGNSASRAVDVSVPHDQRR